jgi:DNA-binding beta-propeller fold protein YncE
MLSPRLCSAWCYAAYHFEHFSFFLSFFLSTLSLLFVSPSPALPSSSTHRSSYSFSPFSFLLLQSVGSHGSALGQFHNPWGVALTPDQAQLVVADQSNERVVVLDATDGRPMSAFTPAAGVLNEPCDVLMVPHTGQVLVADDDRHQLVLFHSLTDFTVVRTFGEGLGDGDHQLSAPGGMALVLPADVDLQADPTAAAAAAAGQDSSLVAIADQDNHRVVLYRLRDATFVRRLGSHGDVPGRFDLPRCLAIIPSAYTPAGSSGWLAVSDEKNRRVQVLTQVGQVVRVLTGDTVNGLGPLSTWLFGITVCCNAHSETEVLLSDAGNHRIVALRLDGSGGRVVCGNGKEGSGEGELNNPAGLVVMADGGIWVVEYGNDRVSLFR